jgi:hypothetical protein
MLGKKIRVKFVYIKYKTNLPSGFARLRNKNTQNAALQVQRVRVGHIVFRTNDLGNL